MKVESITAFGTLNFKKKKVFLKNVFSRKFTECSFAISHHRPKYPQMIDSKSYH